MRTIILFCLLFVYGGISAQWDFGAYVNITRVKLEGDSPKNFSYRATYHPNFGAIINFYAGDDVRISFQPGYAFNKPVLVYRDRELDEKRDSINLNLNYIRLPIYLDIVSDNDKWHFVGGVDLQLALNQVGKTIPDGTSYDLNDELTNLNPVIIFGLGRRIPIGETTLNVDLRFGQGVLNISNEPDDVTSLVPRMKTSTFELLVGYELNRHIK